MTFIRSPREAASSHLRSLLRERAMLIVVDDAWDAGDASKFQVGGPSCLVLITTREAFVERGSAPDSTIFDAMTVQQALRL